MDQDGMAEHNGSNNELRLQVEQAVAQAFQSFLPQLQAQVAQQVLGSLPPKAEESPAPPKDATDLVLAVSSIHAGTTQKEILRSLLDAGSLYGARIALFVVKSGNATGWQARGFGDDDAVKDFSLDMNAGPVQHAFQHRAATPSNIAEMGDGFMEHFGRPRNEQAIILPLTLKDKVAALVYADGGDSGTLQPATLELLVMATGAWLEVASLRKQSLPREEPEVSASAHSAISSAPAEHVPEAPLPAPPVSSEPDPFAAHAAQHISSAAPIPAEPQHIPEPAEVAEGMAAHASAASAPGVATDPLAGLSPEDADLHRKAQRFARLLVDEIKLYNQVKVAEGRRNKDLYDRLKEDIDKSRGTFDKRYGSTLAASGDYFQRELLRSLAEDDASIMGPNFRPYTGHSAS